MGSRKGKICVICSFILISVFSFVLGFTRGCWLCFQRVFLNVLPHILFLFICFCFQPPFAVIHGCVLAVLQVHQKQGQPAGAIWVFPGFDATRVCLEHVHSGPDCPGDLFSHRKPLPGGQLLSQHGWTQIVLELSPWAGQVSVWVPVLAVH